MDHGPDRHSQKGAIAGRLLGAGRADQHFHPQDAAGGTSTIIDLDRSDGLAARFGIDLDDRFYLADVGFGVLTLTGPLRLDPDVEQVTPHEPFRRIRSGGLRHSQ